MCRNLRRASGANLNRDFGVNLNHVGLISEA